eukprot:CAMPEP_0183352056 /NCGR_PEP_ID=MMETSP0164_2-20130417/27267_1 /TAXON_ID=221442 /ORGANISM="Coccolithus pelagicus ssp braarudi, Strain PLY182g" /LENGTH=278 /DNA_ID=CAMNT_0025524407 /DNA_START=35 /DNA_END=870 /DNA_ORIENTATION=+
MSARAESWRYQEPAGFARFEGLPSPPYAAADPASPILEYASFLEPLSNFSLDDDATEVTSPSCAARGSTDAPEQTGKSRVSPSTQLRGFALSRQHSRDLEIMVQSAFDEMDVVLAKKSKLSASAAVFLPSPPPMVDIDEPMEPTVEEQAWLDRQCDAMEQCSAIEAEAEAEERFVQRLLAQHPTLHADEARELYDVEYPSSPEALTFAQIASRAALLPQVAARSTVTAHSKSPASRLRGALVIDSHCLETRGESVLYCGCLCCSYSGFGGATSVYACV